MLGSLRQLKRDSSGATAIEYALIAALVALAFVGGATQLGSSLSRLFTDVKTEIDMARCVQVGSNCNQSP